MKTFTDNAGRTWTIAVNVDAIKRVRGLLQVDLLAVVEGKLIEQLIRDPVLLCDVIYAVCKPEADANNISDTDFGKAMAGDAIEHATKALLEELANFSPNPRDRANLGRVLTTTWAAMDKARDLIGARLENLSVGVLAEQALTNVGTASGKPLESSASTPAPSPSAS